MMRIAKALAVTALGVALAFGSAATAVAAPAAPATGPEATGLPISETDNERRWVLGGVNLAEFCVKLGHRDVTLLQPANVWSWACVDHDGGLEDINMYAACQWQYNKQWAKPDYHNEHDPYSWYCYLD